MDCLKLQGFLGEEASRNLYQYALSRQAHFSQTGMGVDDENVDVTYRHSFRLKDLGAYSVLFNRLALAGASRWADSLGLSPFSADSCELEIVSHPDGGVYKRHIDTFTSEERTNGFDRVLTLVYYFHGATKNYAGGELKLYPGMGLPKASGEDFFTLVPEQDTAIVFPSWMPHEVLPVRCASGRFHDSRFSVNCWVLAKSGPR
jgi:Rps23 Pro-64 3,4-dihydroxylase Tpa1-like proline 4-hydroxylase